MAEKIVAFLREISKLKSLDRTGWVIRSVPKPESVAGHMYRMSLIALLALDRSLTADLDMDKVIKMCLVHDMAECIVGDITPHDGIDEEEKHRLEMEAMQSLCKFCYLLKTG
jgi:putative hydrolase of HD superfamily